MEYNWALAADIREGRVKTTLNEVLGNGVAGFVTGLGISQIPDNSLGPNTVGVVQGAATIIAGGYSVMGRQIFNQVKYNLPPTSAVIKGTPNDLAFLVGEAIGMGIGHAEKIIPAIQKYF